MLRVAKECCLSGLAGESRQRFANEKFVFFKKRAPLAMFNYKLRLCSAAKWVALFKATDWRLVGSKNNSSILFDF